MIEAPKKKRGRPPKIKAELVPVVEPLNQKYLAFVQAYMSNGNNATKAAVEAGFGASYGSDLLRVPFVAEQIDRARERLIKNVDYDASAFFRQTQRLLAEAEKDGAWMAVARFVELSGRMAGHLVEREPEKPKLDMRAILDAAKNPPRLDGELQRKLTAAMMSVLEEHRQAKQLPAPINPFSEE